MRKLTLLTASAMLGACAADDSPHDPGDQVPGYCTDQILNGDERDVDCGGSCPEACDPVELRNDGLQEGDSIAFMGGFVAGECFASTFVPESHHYPLRVDKVHLTIGGATTMETLDVALMSVDQGAPADTLADFRDMQFVGFDGLTEMELPGFVPQRTLESGEFAISVCVRHNGLPGIARDDDGDITPNRNWIFTQAAWSEASTHGVTGDWIIRVFAELL